MPRIFVLLVVCFSAIFYYAVDFFKSAGIEEAQAKYANLGVGAIMVFMTFVTIPLMDRLGRRVLQITSLGANSGEIQLFFIFKLPFFSWHSADGDTDHHSPESRERRL